MSVFWITGSSSGIGAALAAELNSQGHEVILSGRNESKLHEVKSRLQFPDKARILAFDITDHKSSSSITDQAIKFFGHVDKIVLNAGLSQRSLVQETPANVYRELMETNFFGNVALTQSILPAFMARNKGHFVVISSLVGKFGTPYRSGYAASKHALHGFYDSLRAEMMMQQKDIDVTIICPGFVSTDISFNALGASGFAVHVYDEANSGGITPAEFAKRATPKIMARVYEAYIGGKELLGIRVKRFFPNMFVKMIAKAKVR